MLEQKQQERENGTRTRLSLEKDKGQSTQSLWDTFQTNRPLHQGRVRDTLSLDFRKSLQLSLEEILMYKP